ncbi:MAG: polyphenol oxidase family protein [Erythrobacter sp.]
MDFLRAAALGDVPHGFFGRSGPDGAQFDCGFSEQIDQAVAQQNRLSAAATIQPPRALIMPDQIHSTDVLVVDAPFALDQRPKVDALVTNNRDLVIGIVTADCAPVLLADQVAGVVCGAHAGWRGAVGSTDTDDNGGPGILENAVEAMEQLGAERNRIVAAIGPCIAQQNYEVDAPFLANFDDADQGHFTEAGIRENVHRWHFDLPGYAAARLASAGVGYVEVLDFDTYAHSDRYYSFRHATRRKQPNFGRQISVIAAL